MAFISFCLLFSFHHMAPIHFGTGIVILLGCRGFVRGLWDVCTQPTIHQHNETLTCPIMGKFPKPFADDECAFCLEPLGDNGTAIECCVLGCKKWFHSEYSIFSLPS